MTATWAERMRIVEARAAQRCEYCRMHQSLQGATFHVEHIQPSCLGGSQELDNLAFACPSCNFKKSDRTTVADPDMDRVVALFNPRTQRWEDHVDWVGYTVVGRTAIGRALVAAFDLNHFRRVMIREAEEYFDLFPP